MAQVENEANQGNDSGWLSQYIWLTSFISSQGKNVHIDMWIISSDKYFSCTNKYNKLVIIFVLKIKFIISVSNEWIIIKLTP